MDMTIPRRLDVLEAKAVKSERFLVRLRQLVEDLRFDGLSTTDAEALCRKFETTNQALLTRRDALRRESASTD
jgi:hypothetical protein